MAAARPLTAGRCRDGPAHWPRPHRPRNATGRASAHPPIPSLTRSVTRRTAPGEVTVASQEAREQHVEPTPIRRPRADQARLVADVLRHQIHAGGYSGGLPSELDLASEFFVSRNTVREAL